MLKKRALQVNLVKKPKDASQEPDVKSIDFEGKTDIVERAVEKMIKKVGFAVCAYVVLDTIRKVAIEKAKYG